MSKRILPVPNRTQTADQNTLLFMQLHTLPSFASFSFLFVFDLSMYNSKSQSIEQTRLFSFSCWFRQSPCSIVFSLQREFYDQLLNCLFFFQLRNVRSDYLFKTVRSIEQALLLIPSNTNKNSPELLSKVDPRNYLLADYPLHSIPMLTEYLDKENRSTEKC